MSDSIKGSGAAPVATGQSRNVYVASLPLHFDDQQLHSLFSPFGRIVSARIMRAKKTHLSKGYGFVMFRDVSAAERAIESLHGRAIGGMRIQVRWASADASSTFSKVSHSASSSNASTVAAAPAINAATNTAAGGSERQQPASLQPPAAANFIPMQLAPQPYAVYLQGPPYKQAGGLPQQSGGNMGTTIGFAQGCSPSLNLPNAPMQGAALLNPGFATSFISPSLQLPPHAPAAPLLSSGQQPLYLMVMPNGERRVLQLNQLSFPGM